MNVSKAFETVKALLLNYSTFDIGSLDFVSGAALTAEDFDLALENQIRSLVQEVKQLVRLDRQATSIPETLTLIIVQSLLFNVYSRHRNIDTFKLNNSFYNISQASLDQREPSEYSMQSSAIHSGDEMKRFLSMVQRLAADRDFFKKLNLMLEAKKHNAELNRLYLTNLLETIDYILSKQKLSKESFFEARKVFGQAVLLERLELTTQPMISSVNEVVFSDQLNKIEALLQTDEPAVGFALCRLYWANKKTYRATRKCFAQCVFTGEQMLYNLFRHYITSFKKKADLFHQSKHPLYLLLLNYMSTLFLPEVGRFAAVVDKCLARVDAKSDAVQFYLRVAEYIEKDLVEFLQSLPPELWELLGSLRRIIQTHTKWQDTLDPSIPVKVLFLNRFLFDCRLFDIFYKQYDIQDYEKAANLLNEIFFSEAKKKYENPKIHNLIKLVTDTFENGLSYGCTEFEEEGIEHYFIEEPVIRFNYLVLGKAVAQTDFTPKDQRHFKMAEEMDVLSVNNHTIEQQYDRDPSQAEIPESQSQQSKIQRTVMSPILAATGQSLPQFVEYDVFKVSLDLQNRKLKYPYRSERLPAEQRVTPFVTFDQKKKREVVEAYQQYKLHRIF